MALKKVHCFGKRDDENTESIIDAECSANARDDDYNDYGDDVLEQRLCLTMVGTSTPWQVGKGRQLSVQVYLHKSEFQ